MTHVLLVEDDPEVLVVLCDMLMGFGYTCSFASGGRDALAAIDKGGIDVVVTDVRLSGGISGIEVAEKGRAAGISCVMITGYFDAMTDLEKRRDCVWLPKPFRGSQLADAVAAATRPRSGRGFD
jgi:DNA-binding NtrC family response regulator